MDLIGLLILLIIIGLVFWAVRALSGAFAIPQPIQTVIYVILVVFVVLYLLQMLRGGGGGLIGLPPVRLTR